MATAAAHTAPKKTAKKAAATDPAAEARREIIRQLKGPVAERVGTLVPGMTGDVYKTVLENPELLHACLQLFRKHREKFQDLVVDAAGSPVLDDATPLRCQRSVDEIIGMIVRSGARAYADKRFGAGDKKPPVVRPENVSLIERLRALVLGKWGHDEASRGQAVKGRNPADQFYAAIRDNLDHDWQVPLIPHYAELPVSLIAELGQGLTTLRTPEGIAALANIGRHSMNEARKILSDDMMREMLDTQPLAAQGVAFLGQEKYEFLHEAVYGQMGDKFWQMCTDTDRLEAMETKNAKDLSEIADYLHLLGGKTIDMMLEKLQFYQLAIFLEAAWAKLGERRFRAIFGSPGKPKLIKRFIDKAMAFKLDPADPGADFGNRLPDVFAAYLLAPESFERGL